ncbi:MAG: polysaccharide deacetylase family protein [Bacteroidetes bacterium]|nr:polysaccharide deacetylase family protein [Bacteroidota bacterium]
MQDLYIFVPKKSPRSVYSFKLIFSCLLADSFSLHLVSNWKVFLAFKGPKISYGKAGADSALFIPNCGFLDETSFRDFVPEIKGQGENTILFPIDQQADLNYDLPAAVFYLASRYEEYNHHAPDKHGRFRSANSLASQYQFLDWPIAHIWADQLLQLLLQTFPSLKKPKKKFDFLSTMDIDNGFKYRGKPLWRNLIGLCLDCIKLRGDAVRHRFRLLFLNKPDPYDNYRWIRRQAKRNKVSVRLFVLHSKKGKFDHAVEPQHPAYTELLQKVKKVGRVGLHPSYLCLDEPGRLISEKTGLQSKLKRQRMLHVRRHFLRFNLPHSFRQAYEVGFRHEHSMGYSDAIGFRAGISVAYPFFDLERNRQLPLTIHPFAVMETVFRFYSHDSPELALSKIELLMRRVHKYGGRFISVWHDRSFCQESPNRSWAELYRSHLELAQELKSGN